MHYSITVHKVQTFRDIYEEKSMAYLMPSIKLELRPIILYFNTFFAFFKYCELLKMRGSRFEVTRLIER